jgi:hypothetical protein
MTSTREPCTRRSRVESVAGGLNVETLQTIAAKSDGERLSQSLNSMLDDGSHSVPSLDLAITREALGRIAEDRQLRDRQAKFPRSP